MNLALNSFVFLSTCKQNCDLILTALILKEFCNRYYENTTYFNFDENKEYKQFFDTNKNVDPAQTFFRNFYADKIRVHPHTTSAFMHIPLEVVYYSD